MAPTDFAFPLALVSNLFPAWDLNDIDEYQLNALLSQSQKVLEYTSAPLSLNLAKIIAQMFGG